MPRPAKGSKPWQGQDGIWRCRVTVAGQRYVFEMRTCRNEDAAAERAGQLAEIAKHVTPSVDHALIMDALERVADAPEGQTLTGACAHAESVIGGWRPEVTGVTGRTIGDAWIANVYHNDPKYRARVEWLSSGSSYRNKRTLERLIYPVVGNVPADRLVDYASAVLEKIAVELRDSTRRQYLTSYKRLCDLALMLGYADKTLPPNWMPSDGDARTRQRIYPSEDAQQMACRDVPLWRRVVYGFARRNATRPNELAVMTIDQFNFVRKVAMLHARQTKTKTVREWRMLDGTDPALIAWMNIARRNARSTDRMFVKDNGQSLTRSTMKRFPAWQREDLKTAGITRAVLFEDTEYNRNVVMQDNRATFVTTKIAEGWSERKIMQRTGHKTSKEITTYDHAAGVESESDEEGFVPMHLAIPELRAELLAMGWALPEIGTADPGQSAETQPNENKFSHGLASHSAKHAEPLGSRDSIVEFRAMVEAVDMTKKSMVPQPALPSSPVQSDARGSSVAFQEAPDRVAELERHVTRLEHMLLVEQPAAIIAAMAEKLAPMMASVTAAGVVKVVMNELIAAGVVNRPKPTLVKADEDDGSRGAITDGPGTIP